ncbi:MAG: ligase-associated DNA damage response endonuclease PdeM [Synechococcaceae cyanobacterium]|nr:ligase-associated DNA damage response endonuclease PdeM [Synechococcaceae cyanobacterium]
MKPTIDRWPGATTISWHGHPLVLLPQRALWDPLQRLLLLADLHLGKAESFQASGIPLPSDGDHANFNRLLALTTELRPRQVVVLGDLIHGRLGLTARLRQMLQGLPELLGCPLLLVGGNHDAGCWIEDLPAQPSLASGPLWLSHAPERPPASEAAAGPLLNVCGHLHPVALIGRRGDRLRLPCFALDAQQACLQLPAFGQLTGGHPCAAPLQRWVIADAQVLAIA